MGQTSSVQTVNFEDIQYIMNNNIKNYLIINTLSKDNQKTLIKNTIDIDKEEHIINNYINNPSIKIIIYGSNSTDKSITIKYNQLISLGFVNVYVYRGGLFQWLLLQDIYGFELFPTTTKELDILKYKSKGLFNSKLLGN
tara:strand:- start:5257 stop:5676 length:420 start_codon:yes stop_codon:yes gene_type:complete